MMEITEEQYQAALALISQAEEAKLIVQQYEENVIYKDDPKLEIMEKGTVQFLEGEIVRENPLLWRATKLKYTHQKGVIERTLVYSDPTESPALFNIKDDKIVLL